MEKQSGLSQLERPYQEALGFFEALRRCGFSNDDIYIACGPIDGGKLRVQTVLRAQGKEFRCDAGILDFNDEERFKNDWKKASDLWNEQADTKEGADLWKSSYAYRYSGSLVSALALRGFNLDIKPKS